MNYIFHYYITGFIAQMAGFSLEDSKVIAMSSAMTDYALLPFQVVSDSLDEYRLVCTHHYGLANPKQSLDILLPFHFFPADTSQNKIVRPHSPLIKELLIKALHTGNLYRIGIALHTYADTWAHQNFTAFVEEQNRLFTTLPIPPIGHAHASRLPDLPGISWIDPRNPKVVINNNQRFLEAAEYQYRYLCTFQHKDFSDWPIHFATLEQLLNTAHSWEESPPYRDGISTAQAGINRLRQFIDQKTSWHFKAETALEARISGFESHELNLVFANMTNFGNFESDYWYKSAIQAESWEKAGIFRKGFGAKIASAGQELITDNPELLPLRLNAKNAFNQSHLYRWSEAAYLHRQAALEVINQGFRA